MKLFKKKEEEVIIGNKVADSTNLDVGFVNKKSLPEKLLLSSQVLATFFLVSGLAILIAAVVYTFVAKNLPHGMNNIQIGLVASGFGSFGIGLFILFAWMFPLLSLIKRMMRDVFELQVQQPTQNPFSFKMQVAKTAFPTKKDTRPSDVKAQIKEIDTSNDPIAQIDPINFNNPAPKVDESESNDKYFAHLTEKAPKESEKPESKTEGKSDEDTFTPPADDEDDEFNVDDYDFDQEN